MRAQRDGGIAVRRVSRLPTRTSFKGATALHALAHESNFRVHGWRFATRRVRWVEQRVQNDWVSEIAGVCLPGQLLPEGRPLLDPHCSALRAWGEWSLCAEPILIGMEVEPLHKLWA